MADNSPPAPDVRKNMEWLEPDPDWPADALPSETETLHEWSGEDFGTGSASAQQYPGGIREKDGKLWALEAKVRQNPGAALLLALGAGFVAGALWKKS